MNLKDYEYKTPISLPENVALELLDLREASKNSSNAGAWKKFYENHKYHIRERESSCLDNVSNFEFLCLYMDDHKDKKLEIREVLETYLGHDGFYRDTDPENGRPRWICNHAKAMKLMPESFEFSGAKR